MSVSGKQKQVFLLVVVILIMAAPIIAFLPSGTANANEITDRSLTLKADVDPGSQPGGTVDHLFSYTLETSGTLEGVSFEYCTQPEQVNGATCTTPTGLSTTSASLGTQTGASFGTLNDNTNGEPYIYTTSGVSVTAGEAVTTQLDGVVNPSTSDCAGDYNGNCTFYVEITTYTTATSGGVSDLAGPVDTGSVAASINQQITLTGVMPESLIFCTGATVGETDGQPDCTTTTSGAVSFNQLFSPSSTAYATSQMAASTNAENGYVITVNGTTLTDGSYTIAGITSAAASAIGTTQFGMNLVANTTPTVGAVITPVDSSPNYYGQPTTAYGTANSFQFNSGDEVANSADGGTEEPTDAQIYTISYIVNVQGDQPAGTYTTTLTYICTPEY